MIHCPNCNCVWGFDEIQFHECDHCGYHDQEEDYVDDDHAGFHDDWENDLNRDDW